MKKINKKHLEYFINATENDLGYNDYTIVSDYEKEFVWNIEEDWFDKVSYRISELTDTDEDLEEEIKEYSSKRNKKEIKRRPSIIWLEKYNSTKKDIADLELVLNNYKSLKKPKNYFSLKYEIESNNTISVTIEITPDKTEFAPEI